MHRDDEFAISQSEMRFAVFNIKFAQGNAAMTFCTGNANFSTKNEQGGRKIAGEGGVTTLSLRGNVANIPAVLEAISIGAPPPFALIVVNAARVEAQIAADSRHDAVTGPGDRFGGLRERAILAGDIRVASKRGDGHARADRH